MNTTINKIIENNFNDQIKHTADLIKIKSYYDKNQATAEYPFGHGAANCLNTFLNHAKSMGFKIKNIDNMIGWAEIGSGDKLYGILVHLDTVPEGDITKWKTDPFSGNIIQEYLYGRGSQDDKGPAAAALYALKALNESGIKINARFRIIAGLDEESGMRCAERYCQTEEIPDFSFSPDAMFPLINGEKGIIQFSMKRTFFQSAPGQIKLLGMKGGIRFNIVPDSAYAYFSGNTTKAEIMLEKINNPKISVSYKDNFLEVKASGVSAHAMHPDKGENAILVLLEVLSQMDFIPNEMLRWITQASSFLKNETDGHSLGIACSDKISGPLTLNTAMINSDGKDLIIRMDIRYPVTAEPNEMENKVRSIAKKLGMLLKINEHKKPVYISADSKEVKALLQAYENITGEKGEPFTIGGGTYCKAFPNAITFGALMPKEPELAHEENECISLDNLKIATKIYAEALNMLNCL